MILSQEAAERLRTLLKEVCPGLEILFGALISKPGTLNPKESLPHGFCRILSNLLVFPVKFACSCEKHMDPHVLGGGSCENDEELKVFAGIPLIQHKCGSCVFCRNSCACFSYVLAIISGLFCLVALFVSVKFFLVLRNIVSSKLHVQIF